MDNNNGESDNYSAFVPGEDIKKYISLGIPVVPLGDDGLPLVYDLYTPSELDAIRTRLSESELKEVYRDPIKKIGLKPVNLLLKQNPIEFWTEEKINRQKWHGIASIAGPSSIPAQSDPNKILLIIQIDADDPKPKTIVRRVIEKRGHLTHKKALVQETPGGGLHDVFAIAVDPNNKEELELWSNRSLHPRYCKPDCKIEVKTWFGGQVTLEPSKYRKDRSKSYVNISGYRGLLEEDPIIYDLLISELKNADCLRFTPEEANKLKKEGLEHDSKYGSGAADCTEKDRELNDPSDTRVKKSIDIILGKDTNENGESHFDSIYVSGQRHDITVALGGHLFHNRIRLEFTKEIIRRLCCEVNDNEVEERINTVDDTYSRGYDHQKIIGRSGLIDAFKRADKNGENDVRSKARLAKLNEAFGFDKKRNFKDAADLGKFAKINEADIIAELARKKIRFMFINAVKQPCAIIKRDDVVELMTMSDKDGNFADVLRQIWRDENEAIGHKLKTTLPEDRLTQARLSLISDAKRLRIDPIKTHLRVAWEKKNEIMRYDLADSLGRQIRIWGTDDGNGVEIINSDHVLGEIKEFENSKFLKEKTPIFFQQYNQTAQVLPSDRFDPKILDVFINDLTNVVGRKASPSYRRSVLHWETEGSLDDDAKIHIAKVGLVSMLVPLIPHHLENVFGPPQAIKSTFLRQKKALIDPTTLDLFLPTKLKDIDKILAQNYFICFDNFYEITREFSDLICAAITGSGTQVRELFTTQTMITLPIKACIAFSSVTRLFTQSDAVSRLLSYEFLPFAEEEGYSTEDEINDRFEEIRPQILACMYHTMSKAINIRNRIHRKYSLGRMADVLEWGEAISQALGYEPALYLKRYDKLKKIQSRHSSSYDPLVYYYRKIYFDIFLKPESEFLNGRLSSNEEAIRKNGYIVFNYKELNQNLNQYAEDDEYDTKKSNKLWPQDSQQLANRTREVSVIISKNDGFAIEVRKSKHNSNEYILGTKEAVEKYVESQEEDYKKQQAVTEDDVGTENSSNEISGMKVVQKGIQLNNLNSDGAHTHSAPTTLDADDQSIMNIKSGKSKTGAPSGGVQLSEAEHLNAPIKSDSKQELPQNGFKCSTFQQKVEQRRSTIQKLNTSGYSQRQIAKIAGISLGIVNRELKYLNGRSVQSVQPFKKLNTCKLKVEHQNPKLTPQFQDFKEQGPELQNLASCDCEWYREDITRNKESGLAGKIYCFCLADNKGREVKLHLEDFAGHEDRFISAILDAIERYDTLAGYAILAKKKDYVTGSFDGDIEQLRKNCIKVDRALKTRFEAIEQRIKFLDLHSIFSCNSTKAFLTAAENVTYRGETLHDVAIEYLKEGKLEDMKGSEIELLSSKVQAEYCLQDARLSLKLAEKDDYRLLKIFYKISKEIGQDFYSTCNYAKPTSWWQSKLKPLNYQKVEGETAKWQEAHIIKNENGRPKKGVHYTGGKVFEPIVGLHKDVITYDVASMYPTMSSAYNISSETINCDCCKEDPDAKIADDLMELINSDLIRDGYEPRPWHYWICRKRRGILSSVMEDLIRKKSEYKKEGLSLEEKAVKLFANSGYGTFGQVHFEYYDFRVAELITGFARHTLLGLDQLLKDNGLQILYGDTDSLFVRNVETFDGTDGGGNSESDIITIAKERFQVDFTRDKAWKALVLLNSKKQYFGILTNGEVAYKKLVGLKNNYPPYFNEIVSNLISKETTELFYLSDKITAYDNNKAKKQISDYLRSAFNILSDSFLVGDMKFIIQKLCYSAKTQKALYEHERNCWQKYIFDEKIEDCKGDRSLAEMSSQAKSIHSFWKIVPNREADYNKKSCTTHPERYTLDLASYKKDLWNCIESILQSYGFSSNECIKLRNEFVNNQTEL